MSDPVFGSLLRRSTLLLSGGALLVTFCYFFVDRPVAYFVHDHGISHIPGVAWPTYPPPVVQQITPVVLAALAVRRAWGPFARWERILLAAGVSLLVAVQFKNTLKYTFGRDWPNTWIDDNPSLIGDDAYGFHPFHGDLVYGSFPSGHMARTLSVVAVLWITAPRSRWLCAAATAAVALGLIGMNYHFVGDVIGGSVVGMLVGMYVVAFAGLEPRNVQDAAEVRS